jgi:hypothetical protein
MARARIKVGALDDIPPGSGKTIAALGHEVTVVNSEGRLVATIAEPTRVGPPLDTACDMPGHVFPVGPATGRDRLQADSRRVEVEVADGEVFVLVEES